MGKYFKVILVIVLCFFVTGCFAKKLEVESMTELHLFNGSAIDGYSYDYIFAENIIFYQKWESGEVVSFNINVTDEQLTEIKSYLAEYKFKSKDKEVSDCEMIDGCTVEYVSVIVDGNRYYVSKKEKDLAFDKLEKFIETLDKEEIETFE